MGAPEFKKIVLDRMYGILKPFGFLKKGSAFFAKTNDVVLFALLSNERGDLLEPDTIRIWHS
jgi:hypothetical protein